MAHFNNYGRCYQADSKTISQGVALIDIQKYRQQINEDYHPAWFPINQIPDLIFDHNEIVELAKEKLRYKAALHPLLFELLPAKFTMPQLQKLYETILDKKLDRRNFQRKFLTYGILKRLEEVKKGGAHKAPYLYSFDLRKYHKALREGLQGW